MKSSLFLVVTQCLLVLVYRRFEIIAPLRFKVMDNEHR